MTGTPPVTVRLEPGEPAWARDTYLEPLAAAIHASGCVGRFVEIGLRWWSSP